MRNRSTLTRIALAGAAALALLLAACGGTDSGGGGDDARLEDGAEARPAEGNALAPLSQDPAPSGGVSGIGSGSSSDSQASNLPSIDERKITRTANLEVTVDNVLDSVQKVEDIAVSAGGFVSSSNLAKTTGSDGKDVETATMKIRVPAAAYTDVLGQLRGVAKDVRSENSEAKEVTEEYTDLQSRLRNLEATEQRYLDLLSRAANVQDILSLEDRLNTVRGQIEQVQGRINVLNDLTDLATISIKLLPPDAPAPKDETKGWVQEAWEASWQASEDVLVVVGSIAIATVVFLPWFLVPGFIGLVGWRIFGRRITDLADRVSGQGGQG